MATGKTESFMERKRKLRQSFLSQFPGRLALARDLLAQLAPGDDHAERLKQLHLIFHTIKGSGASFGFESINAPARAAEQALRETLDSNGQVTAPLLDELTRRLDALAGLDLNLDTPNGHDHGPGFIIAPRQTSDAYPGERRQRLIYLCDDDPILVQELATQLSCFGYRVTPFVTLDALREAVAVEPPSTIIMDVIFPEGQHAGPAAIAELSTRLSQTIPTVFISSHDDFSARLRAVQVGGSAYCPKPVKAVEMAEILDQLTNRAPPEPFHILIVDDDPDMAQFHAMALEESGMIARVVTEPEQVPAVLESFDADLVLMDLYMPNCSGVELAQVLRQIPGYLSLPIIYVSSETNVDRQFKALEVGADGFLTKPLEPERLVTEVHLRAERMRTLRSLMIRDSLTGLFNHNTILQLLEVAMASGRRSQSPICLAMLDVDRFKTVNDTYGHPAGDQVLMALARTLRLRLREVDLVGRYGGEEFAVVLVGLDSEQAKGVIDSLRTSFAAVTFFADGIEFRCTFSAGVAGFPEFTNASALTEAADRALYRAKHAGRNRVEIAHEEPDTPSGINAVPDTHDSEGAGNGA
ncbi:diguanylate cyclase [Thiobaca trueperi]|uniref:diguanylate cyclase n=1 Tax=Thiobaca trueperi TaxID=127458 RepID=A0A4R3MVS3_9GAMM|nr:diguanylate cyclase [Thiobaca trueperi]TCT20295.1 response regulator receiver modulated diguanylate cyclase [Thiobaca trueperi]